jgi:hypothetical protein
MADKAIGVALWGASFRVWDASSWEPWQYLAWAGVILAGLELMALLVDKVSRARSACDARTLARAQCVRRAPARARPRPRERPHAHTTHALSSWHAVARVWRRVHADVNARAHLRCVTDPACAALRHQLRPHL